MASGKKQRKAANQARKQAAPPGPFRHPDGDRRRRGGPDVSQAIKDKRLLRLIGLPPDEDGEPQPDPTPALSPELLSGPLADPAAESARMRALLDWIAANQIAPQPGTPDSADMLREDRDR